MMCVYVTVPLYWYVVVVSKGRHDGFMEKMARSWLRLVWLVATAGFLRSSSGSVDNDVGYNKSPRNCTVDPM